MMLMEKNLLSNYAVNNGEHTDIYTRIGTDLRPPFSSRMLNIAFRSLLIIESGALVLWPIRKKPIGMLMTSSRPKLRIPPQPTSSKRTGRNISKKSIEPNRTRHFLADTVNGRRLIISSSWTIGGGGTEHLLLLC